MSDVQRGDEDAILRREGEGGADTVPGGDGGGGSEAEESVTHFYRLQYELIAESARRSGRQNFIDRAEKLRTLTYEDALRGNVLVGTEQELVDRLQERREAFGVSYVTIPDTELDRFAPIVARLAGQ